MIELGGNITVETMESRAERKETPKRILPARKPVNLNQDGKKDVREGIRRLYGSPKDKAYKAGLRRWEKEEVLEDQSGGMQFLRERYKIQLGRALEHVFGENVATLQEMDYIDRQGKEMERFTFPEGLKDPEAPEELPEVIITIVDFTKDHSRNSS